VSGELGGAALALVHPEIPEAARRLHQPEPRVELGERLRRLARAAIDVSDGLAGDLAHIAERSGVQATVEYPLIPRPPVFKSLNAPELEKDCVLSGGDDYELAFTAPREHRAEIESLAAELGLALTRIGRIEAGAARVTVLDAQGRRLEHRGGFDHFAGP
jgi:thiamine-monophosphate kinase